MKKYIDKIFELGFGKTYNFEPFTKIIDYEKLLNKLGEKYPLDTEFHKMRLALLKPEHKNLEKVKK